MANTESGLTEELQGQLDRLKNGDTTALDDARSEVIRLAGSRLEQLARRMLRKNPRLHRWEETADVLQNALVRLHRALETVKPDSARQLFGLAATQIRRELVDLARHHFGPMGDGAHHHTDGKLKEDARPDHRDPADRTHEPSSLAEWTEFHEKVELLPESEREVFHLLWYEGLNQEEAASMLGVTSRTIKNRWRNAKISLQQLLQQGPETEE
jgi:RNA polymerase sigma-70 factor (ECF subfamily)